MDFWFYNKYGVIVCVYMYFIDMYALTGKGYGFLVLQ